MTKEIETITLHDMEKLGYKQRVDGHGWYLGNSKHPTHSITGRQEAMIGRTFQIKGLERDRVLVELLDGDDMYVPMYMIKTKIKKLKPLKTIFRDEVIAYSGYGFDFPCSMRNIGREEAIKMAKWVLKVTR